MLAQYQANLHVPNVQVINSGSGGMRWRCSQAGLVKINFDGAVFSASNMFGIGVVIWDRMELFWLLAHKKSLKHTRLKRLRRWQPSRHCPLHLSWDFVVLSLKVILLD